MNYTKTLALLEQEGIAVPADIQGALNRYAALIREWNPRASLVSSGDIEEIERRHFPDALSLARFVIHACRGQELLLDIGSGAGLPAIPLKLLFPRMPVVLVERSERKVAFLKKVVAHLGLKEIRIVCTSFPEGMAGYSPRVITARAVERPGSVVRRILEFMPKGTTYLCQSAVPLDPPEGFHVERVSDAWTRAALRRGSLRVVRREAP
jgi:16S rRNA (guanine(527)-N(7))-methyltransferase RsmG